MIARRLARVMRSVTRSKFPVDEPQPEVTLEPEDQQALDDAIAAARGGTLISWEALRASLRNE